jgi:hypothetical protein
MRQLQIIRVVHRSELSRGLLTGQCFRLLFYRETESSTNGCPVEVSRAMWLIEDRPSFAGNSIRLARMTNVGQERRSTLQHWSVGNKSLPRLTCPACPAHCLPVEVFSTFGGASIGQSLDGGVVECWSSAQPKRRCLLSPSSSATRHSLASSRTSRELNRAKSCLTNAHTAGVISAGSSEGVL